LKPCIRFRRHDGVAEGELERMADVQLTGTFGGGCAST